MPDTPAAYVWLDVGHINDLPDGTLVQRGHVAVDPDSGAVLDPQPDYPKDAPEAAPKSSKSAS